MSLADLLIDPRRPAVSDELLVHAGGVDYSREQILTLSRALCAALVDVGVEPGMPVGVLLPNGPAVVAALFGVWQAGAVYVPLNPRATVTERNRILAQLRPAAIITTAPLDDTVNDRSVIVVHKFDISTHRQPIDATPLGADVALIQFTSGTTGDPKPVQLTHSGVLQLLDGVIATLRGNQHADPGRRPMPNLVPVSLSLWAGIYQVLFAARVGAAIVVMDAFDTRDFAELVGRFSIRSTVLPPAAMTALADDAEVTDLAPLRFVRSITAPLSPLQARRFRAKFGIAVLNSYGQTEIGGEIVGWSAADSKEFGETKLGSVGRPHSGVHIRALAADGTAQPAGGEGELVVLTPSLAAGYADGTELADRLTADGWFRTGDVGRVDEDGFVWIEGRMTDMINRGGLKVHPDEVEEVLRLSPNVGDVAVVGVPDDRLGEVPWAFVVGRSSHPIEPSALELVCRGHLAPYKIPVRFESIDDLPRNDVGKVLKRVLAERACAMARQ